MCATPKLNIINFSNIPLWLTIHPKKKRKSVIFWYSPNIGIFHLYGTIEVLFQGILWIHIFVPHHEPNKTFIPNSIRYHIWPQLLQELRHVLFIWNGLFGLVHHQKHYHIWPQLLQELRHVLFICYGLFGLVHHQKHYHIWPQLLQELRHVLFICNGLFGLVHDQKHYKSLELPQVEITFFFNGMK
jgi:sulfur relay (sulfurtransferase) DsrF/TusC family protein